MKYLITLETREKLNPASPNHLQSVLANKNNHAAIISIEEIV